LFGPLRGSLGPSLTVDFPSFPITLAALLERLASSNHQIGAMRTHLRIAVNQEFAEPDGLVESGDEVALIPAVSGG
jgi:molybdopterin synthase catalytic subunit